MKLTRNRYQHGSLTTEKRSNGPDVWVYRWREAASNRQTVQRKRIIGNKKEFPTETAAWRAVDGLRLDINAEVVSSGPLTIREVVEHFLEKELSNRRGEKTQENYSQHIRDYILPRWGSERLSDIKAFRVEEWLKALGGEDGIKAKTKVVFSVIYQHAMRYGWAERNPIREVRQSAKSKREFAVLTPLEASNILASIPGHARVMAVVAALTGLRRSEVVGLKWADVDFTSGQIHVKRSVVEQIVGKPKTKASEKAVPMELALARELKHWRSVTDYPKPDDWVFASPYYAGRTAYWPGTVLTDYLQPAAKSVGIEKSIGWHTFRRTIATLLLANGESVKTAQETLRHASPTMTLGLYAQAVTEDRRAAQSRLGTMFKLGTGGERHAEFA